MQGNDSFAMILVKKGILNEQDLNNALRTAKKDGNALDEILVQMEYCSEEDVCRAIAEASGLSFLNPDFIDDIDKDVAQYLPEDIVRRHNIVPVKIEADKLHLASNKPLSPQLITNLRKLARKEIRIHLTTSFIIKLLLKELYNSSKDEAVEAIDQSVVDIIDELILKALKQRASDIHFEPHKTRLRVRVRIDGVLRETNSFPKELAPPIISRLKVLSLLDIAEKRSPQDGHFVFTYGSEEASDVRISILPTINGEKAVLRLLPAKRKMFNLESLGMEKDVLEEFRSLIKRPYGIILITGPTGSGKTTTLYAGLQLCLSEEVNITTIEDPVEFQIDDITQIKIDRINKVTFPKALRAILRQDPDIIMVGEIRDQETADIALRAALTGHLVFSTLHTNDASSAITRLLDMGCEPYLVSSAVCGILAQRLVRVNCQYCKKPFTPSQEDLDMLGVSSIDNRQWFEGSGCWRCQKTGYLGRIGVFEFLKIDNAIHQEIILRSPSEKIKRVAVENGMRTLHGDVLLKVMKGITSPREALRITRID